ncbi:unnamed protein product [Caenorhabditis sp. 36 PRJEB53466]|nr:unnamed protein product [Caenorhabditis sp. 36 PRJEB53466]
MFSTSIQLFSTTPTQNLIEYSDSLARNKLIFASIAAYAEKPELCLEKGFQQAIVRRQITVLCDVDLNDTCSGYTAVSPTDKAILVVFRGTTSNQQLLVEAVETVVGNHAPWPAGGVVSQYFHDGFFKMWNTGMKDDFNTLLAKYPGYQVWVTGHSLGGSLASLAASYISNSSLTAPNSLLLITFGQPRTGNATFAWAVDRDVPNAFRVVHSHDPIPHLPGKGHHGYWHHKSEVFYNKNMGGWVICEEDESEKCSDGQGTDTDINDHLHYFNKDILTLGYSNCQNTTGST